jgi:plasmid stabilization system protein ParE
MKIRYKRRALEDLESIHSYIAKFDQEAAKRVIGRIQRVIGRLAYLPWSGRAGVVRVTRILVVPGVPYVAIYRVREDAVEIVAVLHTARRRRS